MSKKIVLIPGAFNPITNAHIELGIKAKKIIKDATICYVLSNDEYLKSSWKNLTNEDISYSNLRYALTMFSVNDYGFIVSDIESNHIVNGKTYNTVQYFKKKLGYDEVYLCMGTDKLQELEKWYKAKELVSQNKFLIVTRDGNSMHDSMTKFTKKFSENFMEIKNDEFSNVSSSKVREALKKGDFEYLKENVPSFVYSYFCKQNNNLEV